MTRQWITRVADTTDYLITLYPDGTLEVAPRVAHSSWGAPLPVRALPAFLEQRGGAA
jgi:hypothetical protein